MLRSVTECDGADKKPATENSATRKCKLPLPFEYSLGSYEFKPIDVDGSDPTPVSVVDINGDGRSDLISAAHGGPDLRVASVSRRKFVYIFGEGIEDLVGGFGPGEWFGVVVPRGDPVADVVFQGGTLLCTPRRSSWSVSSRTSVPPG